LYPQLDATYLRCPFAQAPLLVNVAQANKQRGIKKHLASHKLDQYIAVDVWG